MSSIRVLGRLGEHLDCVGRTMHTRHVFYRDAMLKNRAFVLLFGDFQVNSGLDDRLFMGP